MKELNYFLVSGYGWTGSSALVDMLKEYRGSFEADVEFRLIKDSHGIRDLYNNIVECWDPLNADIAIREFRWFVNHLNAKKSKVSLFAGLGYKKYFGENFQIASEKYINELIEYKYDSFWWYLDFISTPLQILRRKVKKYLLGNDNSEMFFSAILGDVFLQTTRDYIDELFIPIISSDTKNIILDQAVSAQNCMKEIKFINNSKLIIIDRDPRDIYADLKKDGNLIGKDLKKTNDVEKYIKWHKALRRNMVDLKNNDTILFVYFEDLVLRYEETKKRIETFLGLSSDNHINKGKIFLPECSKKNIGIWKQLLTEEEVNAIETHLKEYIYDTE